MNNHEFRDSFGVTWMIIWVIVGMILQKWEIIGVSLIPYFVLWGADFILKEKEEKKK